MMTHRVVRRSYCVCWNVRASELPRVRQRSVRIYHDEFEKIKYAHDMSIFVIKKVRSSKALPRTPQLEDKSTDALGR